MGKCPWEKLFTIFMVFHSTVNLFLQTMSLLIRNISLQKHYSERFTVNIVTFYSKCKILPTWMFSFTQYYVICDRACEYRPSEHKKHQFLVCLLYHNLITIYTTATKSSSLLQNLMGFLLQLTEMR